MRTFLDAGAAVVLPDAPLPPPVPVAPAPGR